jgi:hypothetical protein
MEELTGFTDFETTIIVIGALITIVMLLFFMTKNRVNTKWFSTNSKVDLSTAIPRIDRYRDADLTKYVDDSKEIITASLPSSLPRMLRLLLAQKIRSPLYYRIQHNSLTQRFSTQQGIKEWVELVSSNAVNNANYIIDYCNLDPESPEVKYLQGEDFTKFLHQYYYDIVDRFSGIISGYCYEKIDIYKRSGDKELYEKNEKYILNLRIAVHS